MLNDRQLKCLSMNAERLNKNSGWYFQEGVFIRLSTNLKEVLSLVLMRITRGLLVVFSVCITSFTGLQAMKEQEKGTAGR